MVNTSTGIEPFFSWIYFRNSRLGVHKEVVAVAQSENLDNLPDYFVTTMDLTPEEHVRMQAVIQKHIDSAISKTVNLPKHALTSDIDIVYRLMYSLGCKGGTVYRDGSRDKQVLVLETNVDEGLVCDFNHECIVCKE